MPHHAMELESLLTLSSQGKLFANPKRILLLRHIQATGSISQGAKAAGLSYKAAWDAVNGMNELAPQPLVVRAVGGKGGGGASLTRFGQRLLRVYELLQQIQGMALEALQDESVPLQSLLGVVARCSLQTSARNQLFGEVVAIESRALNDLVHIRLQGGQLLYASVTPKSTQRLGLVPGKDVLALIKGPAVQLVDPQTPPEMKNRLQGEVKAVIPSQRDTEVLLHLGGDDALCAVVENDRLPADLQKGHKLCAAFSPRQVLLAALG